MAYFVTGATGFIGPHLIERLLEREGEIHVLVRESSTGKLDALIESWGPAATRRVHAVVGDLARPRLGVPEETVAALSGGIDDFFHLAAIYDMTAEDERLRIANVEGTRHAVELANVIGAGRFHHTSSIAAAGLHRGLFREDMFDDGQKLDHPYHRTKFEAEKLARTQTKMPWRVYRPSIVVGDSRTGEMDKIDGPYYFFTAIKMARHYLPAGSRWSGRSSATRTSSRSTTSRPRWITSPTCPSLMGRRFTSATPSGNAPATSSTRSLPPLTRRTCANANRA
jgi:thioester reductase-like protein